MQRYGVTEPYGDSKRVPLFDRFFLGGLESLPWRFSREPLDVFAIYLVQ